MNTHEFVEDINRQLDIAPDSTVTFSRNDAFKLMTLLTMLANLIDQGADKTPAQVTALMAQRADAASREVRGLKAEIKQLQDVRRRALAIADERASEAVKLRAEIERLKEYEWKYKELSK